MPLRDLAVTCIVFGLLPMVLRQPYIGVLLWSWISYMNPHRLGWGFAYDLPFGQIVAITLLISTVFTTEPRKIPMTPLTVFWLLFVLVITMTNFFAFIPEQSWIQWDKIIKIQLTTFLTLMFITSRERIIALIWVIAFSIGYFGIKGGIFTVTHGGSFQVWGPAGSFIQGNNELALALLMTMPLFFFLHEEVKNVWIKRGLLASMLLIAFSVVGSYSRGAFVAGGCMLLFLWLKSEKKLELGLLLFLLVPALIAFMPEQWHERMGSIETYQEDGSALGRINAWWTAFYIALDRPLIGGGFEVLTLPSIFQIYAPNPNDLHDAHSIYFEVLAEHGFLALGLFLLIGLLGWQTGRWIIRHCAGHPELKWASRLAAMTQVSLIAYASGGAFLGLAYFDLYYHLLAILLITQAIVKKTLADDSRIHRQQNRSIAEPMIVPAGSKINHALSNIKP